MFQAWLTPNGPVAARDSPCGSIRSFSSDPKQARNVEIDLETSGNLYYHNSSGWTLIDSGVSALISVNGQLVTVTDKTGTRTLPAIP